MMSFTFHAGRALHGGAYQPAITRAIGEALVDPLGKPLV